MSRTGRDNHGAGIGPEELAGLIRAFRPADRPGLVYYLLWAATYAATAVTVTGWLTGDVTWPYDILSATAASLWVLALYVRRLLRIVHSTQISLELSGLHVTVFPPLVQLLEWPHPMVRDVARRWLTSRLPRASPEDLDALSPANKACLYDCLTFRNAIRWPGFVAAILQALPNFADERALKPLHRMTRLPGWWKRLREVRDQARSVVAEVEHRVYQQRRAQASQTLSSNQTQSGDASTRRERQAFGEELGFQPQMRLGFLIAAWAVIVPFGLVKGYQSLLSGAWLETILYGGLALAASQLHRVTLLGRHRQMVRKLLQEKDVRAVGRIAEALVWPDEQVRTAAISALTRLLPQLTEDDASLLTTAQRQCLYVLLDRSVALQHPEAAVVLLQALERIGDVAAIRPVRALAESSERTARMAAVKEAAQRCLPVLLERARRNTDPQILLRPAEALGPPEEVLLRPVTGPTAGDNSRLVRPADPTEE